MPKKIPSPEEIRQMSAQERMKYEIAQELGLMEQVRNHGWQSLTAREAGRIGGLMTKRKKNEREKGK